MGFGLGQVHPDMKPDYLYNEVWWEERPNTQDSMLRNTNENIIQSYFTNSSVSDYYPY